MHTHEADVERNGLGTAVKGVAEHTSALVRLEVELAKLEVQNKVAALGTGIGLLVGALVFGLFGVGFLLAATAAGLATVVATWLALLIVSITLLLMAGALALFGNMMLQKGTPPVPEQAIREAKITTAALKRDGD